MNLTDMIAQYADTPEAHLDLWQACTQAVHETPYLKEHRDFVETGGYGYGERQFHAMWDALVSAMPQAFEFLEIGVFQGQVLSLVALCAKERGKQATCTGITPLDPTGDHSGTHPNIDYLARIGQIHTRFALPPVRILHGMSFDPRVQKTARDRTYDLMLIDGCHDYEVVVDDIQVYGTLVKPGGYLVLDDASNDLQIPDYMLPKNWKGVLAVTEAVNATLMKDPAWKHVMAVGHNRVFQRL
jgi:cephalosporin hydroxylase